MGVSVGQIEAPGESVDPVLGDVSDSGRDDLIIPSRRGNNRRYTFG